MKSHHAGLTRALTENKLLVVYRKAIDDDRLRGYVVGLSNTWVLLNIVEGETLLLDGYKAVRLSDISKVDVDSSFMAEYLRLREMKTKGLPSADVSSLFSLLRTVSDDFPLLMIEREYVEPGVGIVGKIERLTKRSIRIKKFSSKAEWTGTEKFKLEDVTTINFGGCYLEALIFMDAYHKETEELQE